MLFGQMWRHHWKHLDRCQVFRIQPTTQARFHKTFYCRNLRMFILSYMMKDLLTRQSLVSE